jgi:hypothetical protein
MIEELLRIYEEGRVNPGSPACMSAGTLIFNEGWMLRAATHSLRSVQVPAWLEGRGEAAFAFLPFPPGVVAYSEGQLYTQYLSNNDHCLMKRECRLRPRAVRRSLETEVGHLSFDHARVGA